MSKGWHGHENSGMPDLLFAKNGIRVGSFTQVDDGDVVRGIVLLSMEGGSGACAAGR